MKTVLTDETEMTPPGAARRSDRWLIGLSLIGLGSLAGLLWLNAGTGVFSSVIAGLWALCF
jgi:hypothetical protein